MRKKLQLILNALRVKPLRFCAAIGTSFAAIFFASLFYLGWLIAFALGIAFLIAVESILRILFQFAFGKDYRRVLINYSIVDHPRYGYTFRPNVKSRNVNGGMYDRFLYKVGMVPSYDEDADHTKLVDFSVNSKGFRGAEFAEKKGAGVIRIFCSGGSTTAGNNVADNETWPAYLQEYLKKSGKEIEVINGGVFGWYSYQELCRFRDEIKRYQPDVLLLHQGWNEEFEYSSQSLGEKWQPESVRSNLEANYFYTSHLKSPLLNHSLLAFFVAQTIYKHLIFEKRARFSNPERWSMLEENRYFEAWLKNLESFATLSEEIGARLFTVNYPCLSRCVDPIADRKLYYAKTRLTPLFADYQALSKARISHFLTSLEECIPCLDGEGVFDSAGGSERLGYFVDEIHLSAAGNKLFAEAVGKQLLEGLGKVEDLERCSGNRRSEVAKEALSVPDWISRFVAQQKMRISNEARKNQLEALEVPTDRYTTF